MVSRVGGTGRLKRTALTFLVTSSYVMFMRTKSAPLKNIAAAPLKGDRCDAIFSFLCWNGQENA